MDFTELIDLASERVGGRVLAANDEFFAPKENLLKAAKPVFVEDRYTDRGKWMDGWETRRRRTPGYDWCIVELGLPGIVRGVVVDTSYFKGNYPESCSLEAAATEGELDPERASWIEVLPKSALSGDALNRFAVSHNGRVTHLRLNIFPDGGVARLRVHGEVVPDWARLGAGEVDLAAAASGALILASSDRFFGSPVNLILPGPARNMGEGWETRRRRGPGHDWCVIQLGRPGRIRRVEVDTSHFKGNYPDRCSLEAAAARADLLDEASWTEVLALAPLQPDHRHVFEGELRDAGSVSYVRFNIFPDGGVARLRVFGRLEGLGRLNALDRERAERELLECCGSHAWAVRMAVRRPFGNAADLAETADRIWWELGPADWLEAFRAHPRIGERAGGWAAEEQSGTRDASGEIAAALREANQAYEARFGHIFIVCASGKTAGEMLALLRERLDNEPSAELRVAAEEQRKITALRLERLLDR